MGSGRHLPGQGALAAQGLSAEDLLDGRHPGVKPAEKKKRILLTAIIAAALVLLTAGCFGGDKATGPSPTATASSSPAADTGVTPPPAASATAPSSGESAPPSREPAQDVLTGTGSLVGLVDGHSVEIETEAGPVVFQISQEIRELVENWDTGTKVRFEYVKDTIQTDSGQVESLRLVSIEEQ